MINLAYGFFGVVPMIYTQTSDFTGLLGDFFGEIFGTFIFIFFILYVNQTNYMTGEYFKYFILSVMLYAGRM
jgi:glycerol uptake facilitator-like aquaporin